MLLVAILLLLQIGSSEKMHFYSRYLRIFGSTYLYFLYLYRLIADMVVRKLNNNWLINCEICPECGSPNLLMYDDGTIEYLDCGFVFNP